AEPERLGLENAICPEVVRVLGQQLDEHRRAGVANALEGGACVLRPDARRIAVDSTPSLVALEDPLEDAVQERTRLVSLEAGTRERDRRLDERSPLSGREALVNLLEPGE